MRLIVPPITRSPARLATGYALARHRGSRPPRSRRSRRRRRPAPLARPHDDEIVHDDVAERQVDLRPSRTTRAVAGRSSASAWRAAAVLRLARLEHVVHQDERAMMNTTASK